MASMSKIDREDLIITSLMGRFAAHHLYKLKDDFWFNLDFYKNWVNQSNGDIDIHDSDGNLVKFPPEYPRFSTHESDSDPVDRLRWTRYFDPIPINNVYTLESKYLDVPHWKNLIYVVGYKKSDF